MADSTTSAKISPYAFDHIILLLSTDDFEDPPKWLADNFTIIEGGVHAGGSSRNKLIIFPDGTYIELINWITEPKEFFDWASKAPGLIDFALTTPSSAHDTFDEVSKRLVSGDGGLGIRYKQPLAGGRKRKDGQDVKWHVTKPLFNNDAPNVPKPLGKHFPTGRLDTPFFCHDVTDRGLRVPFAEKEISETHPCGATGLLGVEVLVPEGMEESYASLYASVLGVKPSGSQGQSVKFLLSIPNEDEPTMSKLRGKVGVEIRTPKDEDDHKWLAERGVGIRRIAIFAQATDGGAAEAALDNQGLVLVS